VHGEADAKCQSDIRLYNIILKTGSKVVTDGRFLSAWRHNSRHGIHHVCYSTPQTRITRTSTSQRTFVEFTTTIIIITCTHIYMYISKKLLSECVSSHTLSTCVRVKGPRKKRNIILLKNASAGLCIMGKYYICKKTIYSTSLIADRCASIV